MNQKYIHYGHPWVAGLYYQENNTYYQNEDSRDGKVIVLVPEKKADGHKAVRRQ